jgi:hypothetical protein
VADNENVQLGKIKKRLQTENKKIEKANTELALDRRC